MLPVRFSRRPLFLLASLAMLVGCGDADRGGVAAGETGGTLIIAMPAEPTTLLPPVSDANQDAAVINAIFDRLAEIGPTLETFGDRGFRPRLASSWAWANDSLSIAFTIDSLARWHDGQPVEAADVRYTFRVYTSDSLAVNNRAMLGNIDSVSVRDARTAVFWFKRRTPQQFQEATYFMYILPSHLLASIPMKDLPASPFARKPVGSGRFRFANWEAGQRVEIVADTANPRGRAMLDRVIWSIAADFGAATVKLFAGEADFFEYIRPGDLGQIARTPSLRLVDNRALQYLFLGFNFRDPRNPSQPHPLFADAAVRRALHMAVDRAGIVRNVFDSLGAVALGPAPRALIPDTTAFTQLPHDPAHARALLDSAGWRDSDGDGIREREGRRLSFEMLVPSSSAGRRSLTVLLQEQFRAVGAEAKPLVLEVNTFSTRSDTGQFDTYMGGWSVVPGLGGTRQTWTSKGSGNVGRYRNPAFDALVDSALTSFAPAASHRYWARAFQQIVDDAPAIWLVDQRAPVALHKRFIVPPLRPDGWYADLADWRVDPAQRIDRDRIGLAAASR
ncbi:peptide ABC transporter substrate-binding protein [Gemmatimonas aurantiaca]|uniref:peptide ABC transporter substrate-binding protein n=1 Tax=Gemmatimonas aurantiaca TaxID=173480 RepID=UPI00301BE92C